MRTGQAFVLATGVIATGLFVCGFFRAPVAAPPSQPRREMARAPKSVAPPINPKVKAAASPATAIGKHGNEAVYVYSGRVILLTDAFKKRVVDAYADELKNQVVLEAVDGTLIPIVPDWRGRAFLPGRTSSQSQGRAGGLCA